MPSLPPVLPHLPVSSSGMRVPYNDLHAQYLTIKAGVDEAIARTVRDSAFIRGPEVEAFERAFAGKIGTRHCVSCANGTDALYVAFRALGLQPGDEVITSAHSWIASSETVTQAGGRVVFADTDPSTYTLDPADVARKITPRTRGLLPVHLYGQTADLSAIMALAKKHGLWVVEDCAQAHLAHYAGRTAGTFGAIATFSFYPGKNLGAMGDAGCLVTDDDRLADFAAMFARHGGKKKGDHEIEGINSRLDGLQAAILNVKLPHLERWTQARQALAREYDRQLAGVGDLVLPAVGAERDHVYHIYAVRTPARDALRAHLAAQGIQTQINYPTALPFLPAYRRLGHRPADFPHAHAHQSQLLSLPLYPEITPAQVAFLLEQIKAFFAAHRA
ncbi:MAG TPA: DegT/DnrJ/EryC1/StrS family aminotransferase [Opitutaceae bacterium]|nr:DegT/DnrJ/EryC1/StrS family aminotransferase [Opitutaceae bacterium]